MRITNQFRNRGGFPLGALALAMIPWLCPGADVAVTNAAAAATQVFEWKPFLGPFHSLVLHYPIGFLTLAVILEVYRQFKPSAEIREIIRMVIWLSLGTGLIAAILGLLRATTGDYESRALDTHRIYGMLVPVVTILTLYLQKAAYRDAATKVSSGVYRAVLAVNFVLLAIAGHFGGNLTHGSKYLFQNAPSFVRSWLDESPDAPTAAAGNPGEKLYVESIQVILANRCISCHGSEKQKGKYRLDTAVHAHAAGSSGRVGIKPGDPFESEVVRRVLLPSTHDDAMPPDGKEPLSGTELQALVHWIQLGAPYPGSSTAGVPPTGTGPWQGSNRVQAPHP